MFTEQRLNMIGCNQQLFAFCQIVLSLQLSSLICGRSCVMLAIIGHASICTTFQATALITLLGITF